MAAPERFADMSDSSCTAGAVHTWRITPFVAVQQPAAICGQASGSVDRLFFSRIKKLRHDRIFGAFAYGRNLWHIS
jgi:hypothetical protein